MKDQITIGVFDGSDLIYLGLFKNLMNGIKSCAQDGYAQVTRSISTCWHPYLKIERDGINSKEVNSSGINSFFL